MSDADDQMGGHGGQTGKDPEEGDGKAPDPVTGNMGKKTGDEEENVPPEEQSEQADQESDESFPASDPPANY